MPVKYNVVERGKPADPAAPKKFYAQVKSSGTCDFRKLSGEISRMSSLSRADTMAVLECLVELLPLHIADGEIVRLGEFGSFSMSVKSEGSTTADAVNAGNILNRRLLFRPGRLIRKELNNAEFEKA